MKRIISILLILGLCTAGCIGDSPYDPQAQCGTPTNLTFEKGNNLLSWNMISQGEGYYEIQYGEPGFSLGKGTAVVTYKNSYSLPLYKNNKYDLYVRKNCGTANGRSNWAGPITVVASNTTTCVKPGYATYSKTTSSDYSSTFDATVSWENDVISMYETVLTISSAPPAGGELVTGQKAVYIGLSKTMSYNFFVRKRCADNTFSDFYGPYPIKWN
ncbi:hypothetical protein [Chryseobacterium sediminis]|uniref:Fibronectin type III domain-containing protein n=1 Tax=Chryseobacterium sediminis TaxID=1679494 RepID=A0A5B2UB08_9FLAO|nr:hypothetical protein [Chryseobacterium sediminis]KAA2223742.1 hypothetical protein FW780_05945 [Chryseobacterium sediminis]